jgi:hypothetical protein
MVRVCQLEPELGNAADALIKSRAPAQVWSDLAPLHVCIYVCFKAMQRPQLVILAYT